MPNEITVLVPSAVFGHVAFCEVGKPSVLATSPDGLLAVGGDLGWPQWNGFDIRSGPVNGTGPLRGWNRCGIYDAGANCLALVPSRWPINCAGFNPDGTVLAIGTGSYDGGYCFEGELLIIDPIGGGYRSVLESKREVLHIEWVDLHHLRIVVSPAYEEGEPQEPSVFTLVADDWSGVPERSLSLASTPRYLHAFERREQTTVDEMLEQVALKARRSFGNRRLIWAVEATDFGVLAALEGVELEAWERSGKLRYRLESDGRGRQIERLDERSVVTNVEPNWGSAGSGFERYPSVVRVVDVDAGRVLSLLPTDAPVVATSASGVTLLRASDGWRTPDAEAWVYCTADGSERDGVELGRYDLFNHYFAIRRSPCLLALQGGPDRAWSPRPAVGKWVVRLTPRTVGGRRSLSIERLFALEWDGARDGHLMGGPGVFVEDERGQAIVHSGHIHNGAGLQPGDAFVVRRRYPGGELIWQYRTDCQATGVDEANGTVVVAFADGRVVRLDSGTGEVLRAEELRVDGHRVVPLSLCCATGGEIYIGTMDGRILVVE